MFEGATIPPVPPLGGRGYGTPPIGGGGISPPLAGRFPIVGVGGGVTGFLRTPFSVMGRDRRVRKRTLINYFTQINPHRYKHIKGMAYFGDSLRQR